jgi:micrococcal nuclease
VEKKKKISKNKERVLLFILVLILFLNIYLLVSLEETGVVDKKIVTKIIDGDTIIIQGGEKIRLLGVDCDERGKSCYKSARDWIEELLIGKEVFVEDDIEDKDRYGRSLRYIFLDDENVNVLLVEMGFCVARFERDTKYKEEIVKAEEFAIENKVGCKWG